MPEGMTLLDWFAGQVLSTSMFEMAVMRNSTVELQKEGYDVNTQQFVAKYCYTQAEAMMQERERRNGK